MTTVLIQAEVSGYQGKSANLLGALDTDSGLLVVAKELFTGERKDGAVVVSNDPRAERRDSLFTEDKLQDAIRMYFRTTSNELVDLHATVSKHDPRHKIQMDGVGENGTKYVLSPDVTNGAVAVLAMVEAACKTYTVQAASDFSDELASLFLSI